MSKRARATILLGMCVGSLTCGCSAASVADQPSHPDEALSHLLSVGSQPCPVPGPPPPVRPPPAEASRNDAFLEVAVLEAPAALARRTTIENVHELASQSSVRLLGTPHLLGRRGHWSEMSYGERSGVLTQPALHRLAMNPETTDGDSMALSLDVSLQLSNADPALPPPVAVTRFTVAARHDRPVLASAVWPGDAERSLLLLLKLRRVDSEADLREIFHCKMRLRQSNRITR